MNRGHIQQIAPPAEIYDRPANLFVAGFIGSPAMNLIEGEIAAGAFRAPGIHLPVPSPSVGDQPGIVLGARPEDVSVVPPEGAPLQGTVFASELTGECVLITANIGLARVIAKADRAVRAGFGDPIGLRPDPARLHLFDTATGLRLDAAGQRTPALVLGE
jgi:multiple sugar transport system ATP-binding protein